MFLDKTLKRGISHATDNVNIVSQARSELIFIDSTEDELQMVETPVYTFILPDLTQLEGKVQTIFNYLIYLLIIFQHMFLYRKISHVYRKRFDSCSNAKFS